MASRAHLFGWSWLELARPNSPAPGETTQLHCDSGSARRPNRAAPGEKWRLSRAVGCCLPPFGASDVWPGAGDVWLCRFRRFGLRSGAPYGSFFRWGDTALRSGRVAAPAPSLRSASLHSATELALQPGLRSALCRPSAKNSRTPHLLSGQTSPAPAKRHQLQAKRLQLQNSGRPIQQLF